MLPFLLSLEDFFAIFVKGAHGRQMVADFQSMTLSRTVMSHSYSPVYKEWGRGRSGNQETFIRECLALEILMPTSWETF